MDRTINRKQFMLLSGVVTALTAFGTGTQASFAAPGVSLDTGVNAGKTCIENGFYYVPGNSNGIAEVSKHCYATTDRSTTPTIGTRDNKKTLSDLTKIENTSPLHPDVYLARGTMATRIVTDAPRATNTSALAAASAKIPSLYNNFPITTGTNVGGGVGANDNIPIYTVDSSNPSQNFVTVTSQDNRVNNFDGIKRVCLGKIPLPKWAKQSDGGDNALAVYDIATGIWRSYFHIIPNDSKTSWECASAGYWYADDVEKSRAGQSNYWLSLVQGTSSVIGLSNELTQIGFEEVKRGKINHMVSVTFANYQSGESFPAKQSDGNLPVDKFPTAPKAGQVFTFPKSWDIDKIGKDRGYDSTLIAIMKAVQKYGGIVADRNIFCHAFNFENPYGIGAYASTGKNAWIEDSVASSKINSFQNNKFPWAETEWLPVNYAGILTNDWTKDEAPQMFVDYPPSSLFYNEVQTLASLGIVKGYSDGTYRALNNITRDAMVTFLYRSMGSPNVNLPSKSPFVDVAPDNMFYKEIVWAYQTGVSTGWSDGTFKPLNNVTRDAMAAFLYRAAKDTSLSQASGREFVDVPQNLMFAAEIEWMKKAKISTGWSDGTYRPLENTSRDGMAAFLYRWLKYTKRI